MKRTPLRRKTPLLRASKISAYVQSTTTDAPRLRAKLRPLERAVADVALDRFHEDELRSFQAIAKPKRRKQSAYRSRPRDTDRMLWCKTLPCAVLVDPPHRQATRCSGVIEADHQGQRAKGRKAPDDTVVPMCCGHHGERTDSRGTFDRRLVSLSDEREWRARQIARTQQQYASGLQLGRVVDPTLF